MTNKLLILERSSGTLEFTGDAKAYVLEGVFGEIDKKNRNQRIYTEDEYLPQIESLQEKIKSAKLLGELDHPQKFDISLKNVSHVIEEITYDKESKQIRGRIRLLDTDAGRQAKALVDAGVPLHISSRAAGTVESDGKVKIKQLFTYDLVADPGFENAELKRINESLGFENDSDLLIYEINDSQLLEQENNQNKTETTMENKARFVSVEDFNKYSQYLAEEVKSLKAALAGVSTETLTEKVEELKAYVEHVAERADKGIQYTEYVAERLDSNIQYSEYLAEKLDQGISYTEHVAEAANNIKEYANYLAESVNEGVTDYENIVKYVNYLKENLESVTEYADYIAETINSNLIVEGEAGIEAEDMKADMEEVYSEEDKKELEAADQEMPADEGEEGAKEVVEAEAGLPAEDMKADMEEVYSEEDKKELEAADQEMPADEGEEGAKEVVEAEEAEGEEEEAEEVDALESYKKEISEKLAALINKANEKKTENPHFFNFVSESTQTKFNELSTEDKAKVLKSVEGRGYLTESQIVTLMESALVEVAYQAVPYFVEAMPAEYKEVWASLSEAKKSQIAAQAKMVKLTTPYQVRNFWQTRDLRETAPVLEKLEMVVENKEVETTEKKSTIGYDVTNVAAEIAKRFKK